MLGRAGIRAIGCGMTQSTIEYWKPGDGEERCIRIFVSHRWDSDGALYNDVIRTLHQQGFAVQDMSLSAQQVMTGPRGGDLPKLTIQAEVAARIYTSDILIAPSRPGAGRSQWVTWEVQLALVAYGIPVLFVDFANQQRRARLVSEAEAIGAKHAVCSPTATQIARGVAELVGHPDWGVRQAEQDKAIRFRGPLAAQRDDVLKRFPFQARLPDVDLPPPQKRGLWGFITGKRE
jgi:hypothetical protein